MTRKTSFKKLKAKIDRTYPPGRFVAIDEGRILGDAASFEELDELLNRQGHTSNQIVVLQAGVDYSKKVIILQDG